jgi:hypothetical protein
VPLDRRQHLVDRDVAPELADSEVTVASEMPHGTIRSYAVRSGSALSAKPCIVTPARDADADRGDLAGAVGRPDAAAALDPVGGSPSSAQTSMSTCSRRRTYATTSTGSARRRIG